MTQTAKTATREQIAALPLKQIAAIVAAAKGVETYKPASKAEALKAYAKFIGFAETPVVNVTPAEETPAAPVESPKDTAGPVMAVGHRDIQIPQELLERGFEDRSWHNDSCVRTVKFLSADTAVGPDLNALCVWVEHENSEQRDEETAPRYIAEHLRHENHWTDGEAEVFYTGEDLRPLLKLIDKRIKAYTAVVDKQLKTAAKREKAAQKAAEKAKIQEDRAKAKEAKKAAAAAKKTAPKTDRGPHPGFDGKLFTLTYDAKNPKHHEALMTNFERQARTIMEIWTKAKKKTMTGIELRTFLEVDRETNFPKSSQKEIVRIFQDYRRRLVDAGFVVVTTKEA